MFLVIPIVMVAALSTANNAALLVVAPSTTAVGAVNFN